ALREEVGLVHLDPTAPGGGHALEFIPKRRSRRVRSVLEGLGIVVHPRLPYETVVGVQDGPASARTTIGRQAHCQRGCCGAKPRTEVDRRAASRERLLGVPL